MEDYWGIEWYFDHEKEKRLSIIKGPISEWIAEREKPDGPGSITKKIVIKSTVKATEEQYLVLGRQQQQEV